MNVKKYKFSSINRWNNDIKTFIKEVLRAAKFYINQIKKGWSVKEAQTQTLSSYGWSVGKEAIEAVSRSCKNNQ